MLENGEPAFYRIAENEDRGENKQTIKTYAELMRTKGWYQTTSGDIWAAFFLFNLSRLFRLTHWYCLVVASLVHSFTCVAF